MEIKQKCSAEMIMLRHIIIAQEAQLLQRNSACASAVRVYIGWLTDRTIYRTPTKHRTGPKILGGRTSRLPSVQVTQIHYPMRT